MSESSSYGTGTGGADQNGACPWAQAYPSAAPQQDQRYSRPDRYDAPPGQQYAQPAQQYAQPGQQYAQPGQQYGQPMSQPYQQPYDQATPGQPGMPAYGQPGFAPAVQPGEVLERKWSRAAIGGFVVGLIVLGISLFSGYAVASVLPIALSVVALRDIGRTHKRGKALAITGLVLAGLSLILYLVNMIMG
ncbi:MAG: DUF4190 domain-containing protein [Microlunatus sp.]|nr:DUF4190 domain-containing protein [Microlunatus sp.]